jgi:hypothetical protein
MIHTLALVEFVAGALLGWAFVITYQWRTHGAWRRSATGWHLMTFTATLAVIFTLAVAVRVVDIPGIRVIAVVLYGGLVLGLAWRLALLATATRQRREQP